MLGMTFNIVVKDVYMCANYTSMNKKKVYWLVGGGVQGWK